MADGLQLVLAPITAPGLAYTTLARPDTPWDHAALVQAMAQARAALEEAATATALAAQRARSMAAMLDEVLAGLPAMEGAAARVPRLADGLGRRTETLSPREREVLALVADGRSNKAIAAALFVSPNTVKTHVASLLDKLQVDTRVQLAAISARQWEPSWQER